MAQVTTRHNSNRQDLHYIVTDHAGTPQELVREDGEIEWRGEQALWGKYQQQQFNLKIQRGYLEDAANEALTCDLRYQGQLEDKESRLYYNLNRYYDADSGQYLSPDSIGFAGGLRAQGYVHNPMEWVDPLGLLTRPNNGKYHIFHDHTIDAANQYSSDAVQFRKANKELIERMESDAKFRKDLLRRKPELYEWSKSGNMSTSPPGFTWHHHEDTNRLVLVDRMDHSANHSIYHPTGKSGRDIWGGGKDGRQGKLDGRTGDKKCK